MLIKNIFNEKFRNLRFENTIYVFDAEVTLISFNKLKKRKFYWNMFDDSLINKKRRKKICEINEHYDLSTLKFNAMFFDWLINIINPWYPEKAISWIWHLRFDHCRSRMIEKLKHIEGVEVLKNDVFKSIECITWVVSKMHQIINRNSTGWAMKPFQILHFDLTIIDVDFDSTKCITHFTDEFIFFNQIYLLVNDKKAILISIFKFLIN